MHSKRYWGSFMTVVALADCLLGYHSFWIRVGQYLKDLSINYKIIITDNKLYKHIK